MNDDNNIMLVKSGEPRTELQQAYDQIAVLEAKIENLERDLDMLHEKNRYLHESLKNLLEVIMCND